MMRLENERHESFARHIAEGHFASRAYKLAGYRARGNSAESCASRLLRKSQIRARIAELRDEAETRAGLRLERTMRGLAQAAFSNALDYINIDEKGRPVPNVAAAKRAEAAGIVEVRSEFFHEGRGQYARPVRRLILKLPNKTRALVKLAEMLSHPSLSS
jgi:phage terminase small subunit